jgi:hypothetical protein
VPAPAEIVYKRTAGADLKLYVFRPAESLAKLLPRVKSRVQ